MTSPIGGIARAVLPTLPVAGVSAASRTEAPSAAQPVRGAEFASTLAASLDRLQGAQATADSLAVQAATGDLRDVHDYMIAANQAKLATEMVVTVKNKAVDAFNEIMRMPV